MVEYRLPDIRAVRDDSGSPQLARVVSIAATDDSKTMSLSEVDRLPVVSLKDAARIQSLDGVNGGREVIRDGKSRAPEGVKGMRHNHQTALRPDFGDNLDEAARLNLFSQEQADNLPLVGHDFGTDDNA